MRRAWRRIFRLPGADIRAAVDEEIAFHIETRTAEYVERGMAAAEARRQAVERFGDLAAVRDECVTIDRRKARAAERTERVEALWQDARYALRSLRKSPGFTAVATLSIALGIGAATAVFTLANVMLLEPLPYPAAERLVVPFRTVVREGRPAPDTTLWTFAQYTRLRALVPALESAGFSTWQDMNFRGVGAGAAERARVEIVTASMIETLGVKPTDGRAFGADEDAAGAAYTPAMVSHRLWRRGVASLGSTISLNGAPVNVVGIMPPGFTGFASDADVWVPLHAMPRLQGGRRWVERFDAQYGTVIARVHAGVPFATARDQLVAAARRPGALPTDRPRAASEGQGAGLIGLAEARRHPLVEPLLHLLGAAVGAVLLIVCANVAGLLLARGRARATEIGVRIALGAGRGRVARQALTESFLLAALGVIPGIAIAYGGATALAHLRPRLPSSYVLLRDTDLLAGVSLSPDGRVLAFATALALLAGLLFGTGPALAAVRVPTDGLLKSGRARTGASAARGRGALVVGQVALATALLIGAGLMAQSLRSMLRIDLGFDPQGVVVMGLASPDTSAGARARRSALLSGLARLPGVDAAATHGCVPLDPECLFAMPIAAAGGSERGAGAPPVLEIHIVSAEYFRTMRIPLRQGRTFGPREVSGEANGVLLNEAAARLLWADGRSAVGRRVVTGGANAPPAEVIGIVGDAKFVAVDRPPRPALYMTPARAGEGPQYAATLFVRARTDPASTIAAVRREVGRVDASLAIFRVTTLRDLVRTATASTRFVAAILGGFALVAALLAALGVYGVLSFLVAQRTRELGIRIALGATPRWVVALVMRQGAVLTAVGIAIGAAVGFAGAGALARFLFGVARADGPTYAAAALLLATAGLAAALIPAWRATRVDPASVLRE